ncbi:Serine/threonine-protein kinase PAK 6 [Hypoxylon texense]
MAQYATAAITAVTATAAIVSSSGAYRHQDRLYRARESDENSSPWQRSQQQQQQQQTRSPLAGTRSRHAYGHYGQQPLYYPAGIHQHYAHRADCPGSQCHYRAFLTDSIQRYNESRRELRQTYVANLRELQRVHAAQPRKPAAEKRAEADRLYAYYVSRVRDVFDDHRRDHRRLFGHDYLCWAQPEREEEEVEENEEHGTSSSSCRVRSSGANGRVPSTSRMGGSIANGGHVDVGGQQVQGRTTTTVIRESRREGTGCDGEEKKSRIGNPGPGERGNCHEFLCEFLVYLFLSFLQ